MKLPTLWMVCAFASGIALAGVTPLRLWGCVALALAAIATGLALLRGNRLAAAWAFGMLGWAALGGAAVRMEQNSVPSNQVTRLAAEGQLELSGPLRWTGRMRNDSMDLPWGTRYEIDLESVELAGKVKQVTGGLRVNFYADARHPEPAMELRAGDRVEVLVRGREPRNYLDPGAADTRAMLARQNIHLVGSLRSAELLKKLETPPLRIADRLARGRGRLLERVNQLFRDSPDSTAVLRAMLLGDRNFVDTPMALMFQKTAAFHVLVLAGLHVGALAIFVFWVARRLRLNLTWTTVVTLAVLAAYLGVVQDRPPIVRAALMAAIFLGARLLFRRMEMLNGVALAALVLLVARPSTLGDSSFQLSFVAAGVIAGLAIPWIERTSGPYRDGLANLGDATRDGSFPARVVQFRLDLRMFAAQIEKWLPARLAGRGDPIVTLPVA
ncbi:MAG: ComEC/Rec2 family competence protein, partial [Candidatus Acidiferrales bacterium]